MSQTLFVSSRGQMTLPASLRKRFGIKDGGHIILEERDNELVLKPAMVLEVEMYTDAQVAAWDEADSLDDAGRQRVLKRLKARMPSFSRLQLHAAQPTSSPATCATSDPS